MLPDPTIFRNQLDGSRFASYNCTAAAGAMALDAYTGGALVVTPDQVRRAQSDQTGGIGLNDLAEAWRHYGQRFDYARHPWPLVVDRLRAGDGVVIQGLYRYVPARYSSQESFDDGHALYVSRLSPTDATARVYDPLARAAHDWPLDVVEAFYTRASAGYLTGWGAGVYRPPTANTHATRYTRCRVRTGPNLSASIVTTLARAGAQARVEGTVTGSWYRLSDGRRSNRWHRLAARAGRRLDPPLYSAALLWREL